MALGFRTTRVYGIILYREYVVITFTYSLLRTSKYVPSLRGATVGQRSQVVQDFPGSGF